MNDWTYLRFITLDVAVTGSLTNIPVLVRLHSGNFDFTKCEPGGVDIRFTSSDGLTLYNFQRDRHDDILEKAEYKVLIPVGSSNVFRIYYGNSSAVDTAVMGPVWDASFKARYNMDEFNQVEIVEFSTSISDGHLTVVDVIDVVLSNTDISDNAFTIASLAECSFTTAVFDDGAPL